MNTDVVTQAENRIIEQAKRILMSRMTSHAYNLTCPKDLKDYLSLEHGELSHEVFGIAYLTSSLSIIKAETLFRGNMGKIDIHKGEIAKECLKHDAPYAIVYHNHPSKSLKPSDNDIITTKGIFNALKTIDVTLLDHIIIGGSECSSFAEMGIDVN